jgi:hypothetical protein
MRRLGRNCCCFRVCLTISLGPQNIVEELFKTDSLPNATLLIILCRIKRWKVTTIRNNHPVMTISLRLLDTDMEFNTGWMGLITKGNGNTGEVKDRVLSGMLKEMFIKVLLKTIWLMALESISMSMGAGTRESSKMMCRKDMERKSG